MKTQSKFIDFDLFLVNNLLPFQATYNIKYKDDLNYHTFFHYVHTTYNISIYIANNNFQKYAKINFLHRAFPDWDFVVFSIVDLLKGEEKIEKYIKKFIENSRKIPRKIEDFGQKTDFSNKYFSLIPEKNVKFNLDKNDKFKKYVAFLTYLENNNIYVFRTRELHASISITHKWHAKTTARLINFFISVGVLKKFGKANKTNYSVDTTKLRELIAEYSKSCVTQE